MNWKGFKNWAGFVVLDARRCVKQRLGVEDLIAQRSIVLVNPYDSDAIVPVTLSAQMPVSRDGGGYPCG